HADPDSLHESADDVARGGPPVTAVRRLLLFFPAVLLLFLLVALFLLLVLLGVGRARIGVGEIAVLADELGGLGLDDFLGDGLLAVAQVALARALADRADLVALAVRAGGRLAGVDQDALALAVVA